MFGWYDRSYPSLQLTLFGHVDGYERFAMIGLTPSLPSPPHFGQRHVFDVDGDERFGADVAESERHQVARRDRGDVLGHRPFRPRRREAQLRRGGYRVQGCGILVSNQKGNHRAPRCAMKWIVA